MRVAELVEGVQVIGSLATDLEFGIGPMMARMGGIGGGKSTDTSRTWDSGPVRLRNMSSLPTPGFPLFPLDICTCTAINLTIWHPHRQSPRHSPSLPQFLFLFVFVFLFLFLRHRPETCDHVHDHVRESVQITLHPGR